MTIWATLVGRLGDSNWTFGPLWISVLGRGFLLESRLQRRFSLCRSVLARLWTLLKCVPKQLNTDNRLHDPRSAAVLGVALHFCRPNVSTPVVQTSNCCRPNVQPVSSKWSSQKKLSPKRLSPKCLSRPNVRKLHAFVIRPPTMPCCLLLMNYYFCRGWSFCMIFSTLLCLFSYDIISELSYAAVIDIFVQLYFCMIDYGLRKTGDAMHSTTFLLLQY